MTFLRDDVVFQRPTGSDLIWYLCMSSWTVRLEHFTSRIRIVRAFKCWCNHKNPTEPDGQWGRRRGMAPPDGTHFLLLNGRQDQDRVRFRCRWNFLLPSPIEWRRIRLIIVAGVWLGGRFVIVTIPTPTSRFVDLEDLQLAFVMIFVLWPSMLLSRSLLQIGHVSPVFVSNFIGVGRIFSWSARWLAAFYFIDLKLMTSHSVLRTKISVRASFGDCWPFFRYSFKIVSEIYHVRLNSVSTTFLCLTGVFFRCSTICTFGTTGFHCVYSW